MKHVSHYGRLDRHSKKGVSGWCQPAGDSAADGDAPEDLEEDSGTQFTAGLPATKAANEEEAGGFSGTDPADPEVGVTGRAFEKIDCARQTPESSGE